MGFSNDQAVATYVDGVYQFDYFSAPLNFSNIERVEILRGPQGTLYGRNAFGGVLNVITKRPTNKTSGFAEIDLGNYGQQRYSVGFNTPLIKINFLSMLDSNQTVVGQPMIILHRIQRSLINIMLISVILT
jgi:iron complex outermembrane receptor protein